MATITINLPESIFRTTVGPEGDREVYALDFANLLPGSAAPSAIASYLIQRGLDETLGNAWSTQPADGRTHTKVAERLRRIQTDPGAGGRASFDSLTRETMILARKRLADAGLKSDVLKSLSTPDKMRAEIARIAGGADKAAIVWTKLEKMAEEILAIKAKATEAADPFGDLLAD